MIVVCDTYTWRMPPYALRLPFALSTAGTIVISHSLFYSTRKQCYNEFSCTCWSHDLCCITLGSNRHIRKV
jgi:hypothetical protein